MNLSTDKKTYTNISSQDIVKFLNALKKRECDFLVLENPKTNEFLQTVLTEAVNPSECSFHVEYSDVQTNFLYECEEPLSEAKTLSLFEKFYQGDASYKEEVTWSELLDLSAANSEEDSGNMKWDWNFKYLMIWLCVFAGIVAVGRIFGY